MAAGLTTARRLPASRSGTDCAGVIEFFAPRHQRARRRVSALFATVGGQLAQYLERRPTSATRAAGPLDDERLAQRYLDVAGTFVVVLDADGPRAR